MSFVKYRVKEVATDFGISPKEVTEIIGKFMEKPKSYSQVLTDAELNVVFEHMTQKNQIKDQSVIFNQKPTTGRTEAKPAAAPQQQNSRPQRPAAPVQPAAPKTADQLFEEKLKAFMSESDTKLSSIRADHRTKSRRR